MTRRTDQDVLNTDRARMANGTYPGYHKADQFLIIHHNAPGGDTTNTTTNGTETWWSTCYNTGPPECSVRDNRPYLTMSVQGKMLETLNWRNRGIKDGLDTLAYVLYKTTMISALPEISFITCKTIDSLFYYDTNYPRKEAGSVYRGWRHYIENDPIITIKNYFDGGDVLVDGVSRGSPFLGAWCRDEQHNIGACNQWGYDKWGQTHWYTYCRWNDSGAQQHNIQVPAADAVYTSYFSWSSYHVNLIVPNGGENYAIGQNMVVRWYVDPGSYDPGSSFGTGVNIYLSRDGGQTFNEVIATNIPAGGDSVGQYTWQVTGPSSNQCKIEIAAYDDTCNHAFDYSNNNFTLSYPALQIPSNFSANVISLSNKVRLTWNDTNMGTAKTRIYRAPYPCGYQNHCITSCPCRVNPPGSWWDLIATVDEGVSEWIDSLTYGSSYCGYRVSALREGQESSPSNDVIIRTHPNPPTNLYVGNFYCARPFRPFKIAPSDSGIIGLKASGRFDCYPAFPESIPSDLCEISAGYPINQTGCTFTGMEVWSKSCHWYNHNVIERETTFTVLKGKMLVQTLPDTVYCSDWTYYFMVRTIDKYGDTSMFVPTTWGWPYAVCVGTCHIPAGGYDNPSKLATPVDFSLEQNRPNPFNSETIIKYVLPQASHVKLILYNVIGQKVRTLLDEIQPTGIQTYHWDGKDDDNNDLASGIYFYHLRTEQFNEIKKMVLLR